MKHKIKKAEKQIDNLAKKLNTALNSHGNAEMAKRFLMTGYKQDGYGVPEGSAINGSFAFEGEQGYYVEDSKGKQIGKKAFLETVDKMKEFFKRRAKRLGKPIRFIIKPGIGGQHTPFQGISDVFDLKIKNRKAVKICGEYELGKDFESFMINALKELKADWDEVCVIPSSKSGSTDETMMVFMDIFYTLLKHQAIKKGIDGEEFAKLVLEILHEINFIDGKERQAKDLFKVDKNRFGTDSLITLISDKAKTLGVSREQVKDIFEKVLGNMFFETTDRVEQSRLSAFIHNSGMDKELGEDAPGFGAMFDNVGGRWTGDLHMMVFLAYYGLDAEKYWEIRRKGIIKAREGKHIGNKIGNKILDEGITDIAFVVPDKFFWFGKSIEQNFNESIWQNGFSNLIAIGESQWDAQKEHYANSPKQLVINMSKIAISKDSFNVFKIDIPAVKPVRLRESPQATHGVEQQQLANAFVELFTLFYSMTNTVGISLIVRALNQAGYTADDVDLNDVDNPATKIVQQNLYLRQPYVELGKGLLEKRLKALQEKEADKPGAIEAEFERIRELARDGKLETNIAELSSKKPYKLTLSVCMVFAKANKRKFVPFIYLEGERFYNLRDYLISLGIEWVMQGTGDQHISYQQVLAQPQKYLSFIISFIPEKPLSGRPAVGFAKGYLHNISPHMCRDLFSEASYQALTDLRKSEGGKGFFLRMIDNNENIDMLKKAAAVSMFKNRPVLLKLSCKAQNYEWGDTDFIPALLGIDNSRKKLYAELWIGAHANAPAKAGVKGVEINLDDLINGAANEILGNGIAKQFNKKLPYLLKVLAAAEMLSIQAHPNKKQAKAGFERENAEGVPINAPNRNYKDTNHKPEIIAAVTDFYALNGFRPLEEIAELLEDSKELRDIMPDFRQRLNTLGKVEKKRKKLIKELYSKIMSEEFMPQKRVDKILKPLINRLRRQSFSKEEREFWVLKADEQYTRNGHIDRGIFSIYLLNFIYLKPGEAIYLGAGELHAYLEGVGMECMANSDNVLRAGLTPKHVDVTELLNILAFNSGKPDVLKPRKISNAEALYNTPAEEFALSVIEVSPKKTHKNAKLHSADALIVMEGVVEIRTKGEALSLRKGETVIIPAILGAYEITGQGKLYKVAVPAI